MLQGRDGFGVSRWLGRAMVLAVIVALGLTQATNSAAFPTTDQVVISNAGAILAGSLSTFPAGTRANGRPSSHITGTATGFSGNSGAAISPFNLHRYVTNSLASNVRGFAPGDTGNSAPEVVIGGGFTGIALPNGIDFDTDGNIWVANFLPVNVGSGICAPGFAVGTIRAFEPDANGNTFPFGTIAGSCTSLFGPVGIEVDDTPDNACEAIGLAGPTVWAANNIAGFVTGYCPGEFGFGEFSLVFFFFTFPGPDYIALGSSSGEMYVTDPSDNAIDVWNVDPLGGDFGDLEGSIIGKRTKLKLPQGIAASLEDDVYVANTAANSFAQFFGDLLGNVRPFSLIRGPNTRLNQPVGVALVPEED